MTFVKSLIAAVLFIGATAFAQDATKNTATEQSESSESSTKVPVPTGKYITGGILASTVGFGIGHAVQGRYEDKGWIFTATEAASVVALSAGLASCKDEYDSYGKKETKCSNNGLVILGFGALIGFHVWELVDAWTGATPVDENSAPKVLIIPESNTTKLLVGWNF